MVRLTYKPSSVFDNHLSRIIVANNLKRLSDRRAAVNVIVSCIGRGLHNHPSHLRCGELLPTPFHPYIINNAVYFCCTFLEVAFTGN